MPSPLHSLVVFSIDDRQFALDVSVVEGVHRCVEITSLPDAPPGVRGVINMRGTVLPVFDLRAQLGLPLREVHISDYMIVVHTSWRTVVLLADHVVGVVATPASALTSTHSILPGLKSVLHAVTLEGEIVLVHDLDSFLAQEERDNLQLTLEM